MIIKPSLYFEPVHRLNPPSGWYRGRLKDCQYKLTSKEKPGIRIEWELTNDPRFIYSSWQTFAIDNLGLFSRMTWNWKQIKASDIPKIGPHQIPNLIPWFGDSADVHVSAFENGYSTPDLVLRSGKILTQNRDGSFSLDQDIHSDDEICYVDEDN